MTNIEALKLAFLILGIISAFIILLVVWLIGFFKDKNTHREQEEQF